jgi:hypothetical protein
MHKLTIFAAMLTVALVGAAAGAELPTCDAFITRLRSAGRALTVPLPAVKMERNPTVTDYEAYRVSYPYAGDVEWMGSLSCEEGRVVGYQVSFDHYDTRRAPSPLSPQNLRAWHMVSAAVYAFTGWSARQTVDAARKLLDNRPDMAMGPSAEAALSAGAFISVGYTDVIIDTNRPLPPSTGQRGHQGPGLN